MVERNGQKPSDESLMKAMELAWRDHHHARDQTWKTVQIVAVLGAGLLSIDFAYENLIATRFAAILVILAAAFGVGITWNHRKLEIRKFIHIMNCEELLGLHRDDIIPLDAGDDSMKEKIKLVYVNGVKGISQVLPVKRGEEYLIVTSGTNLKAIMKMNGVDKTRTTTNNLYEIEANLGIEAARQAIIHEIMKVLNAQGINIDMRHIMLVADTMCMSGNMLGISRYGIVKEKPSVLARASFETPLRHIFNAAMTNEVDELNSVIENVMMNQPVPLGTGLPHLVTKTVKTK